MDKELISFNIRLKSEVSISFLIEIAKTVFDLDNYKSVFYEYNIDVAKCVYKEERFENFQKFYAFYSTNEFRFDMLKFETDNEQAYIGFRQSNGDLGVFGRIKNRFIFDRIMRSSEESVLYAHIHNTLDMLLSRTNKTRSWKRRLGYIPEYVTTYRNPRFESGERDEFLVDLKSFPTHQHLILTGDKLWFGACAEMYFSNIYNEYIPSKNWDNLEDYEENEILPSGLRKISLYENFGEFEKPENRKKQWDFRKKLNIDEIANLLKKN